MFAKSARMRHPTTHARTWVRSRAADCRASRLPAIFCVRRHVPRPASGPLPSTLAPLNQHVGKPSVHVSHHASTRGVLSRPQRTSLSGGSMSHTPRPRLSSPLPFAMHWAVTSAMMLKVTEVVSCRGGGAQHHASAPHYGSQGLKSLPGWQSIALLADIMISHTHTASLAPAFPRPTNPPGGGHPPDRQPIASPREEEGMRG